MSYHDLEKLLGMKKPLPVTEQWSAAADFLLLVTEYCLANKPRVIVECSSGTSSLVLARCCQLNGQGHVYSLENGEPFLQQTQQQLADFSLTDYCDVLHAPLKDYSLHGKNFQWYDLTPLAKVEIDMLVIDGPPGFIQKHSRYPALPLLHDRLAEKCTVYLDDAARDDEQEIVELWQQKYHGFTLEYIDNERGCSVLTR